jgi:hypothetical protein
MRRRALQKFIPSEIAQWDRTDQPIDRRRNEIARPSRAICTLFEPELAGYAAAFLPFG